MTTSQLSRLKILVTGATGTQGGAVAAGLLAAGHDVHALVRDPGSAKSKALAERGFTLHRVDLLDPASLADPFGAVDAVYAVTTPFGAGTDEEVAQGEGIIGAAQAADVPWLILASVASAGRAAVPHFESKARIEAHLAQTELPWTVVAPSFFFENVAGPIADARTSGEFPLPVPSDVPLHQLALADLGAAIAAIVTRKQEHLGVRVELAADAPTPAEMAAAVGARHTPVPIGDVRTRSEDLAAMYEFLSTTGYAIDVEAVRAKYPEVSWTRFTDWAAAA